MNDTVVNTNNLYGDIFNAHRLPGAFCADDDDDGDFGAITIGKSYLSPIKTFPPFDFNT